MSLFGIAASGDLRARLPEPFGFLLAAIDDRLARVEVSDNGEHAAVIVFRLGQMQ